MDSPRRVVTYLAAAVVGVGFTVGLAVAWPQVSAFAQRQGGSSASNNASVTSTVGEGAKDTNVGTATFTLSGGSVVVDIAIAVSGDTGASVCLSPTAFTSRVNPSQCSSPDVFAKLASSGGSVALPASFLSGVTGDTIYAQLHVSMNGGTAFAGWTSGTPFYGNDPLALPQTSGAIGPSLTGVAGISLLAVAGAGLVARSKMGGRS
jgi:hypothetical protein